MPSPLKIAVVTDIHNGRPSLTKRGPEAVRLLEEFRDAADGGEVDLVVELGDRITDTDEARDRDAMEQVAEVFASMATPHHHVIGNHDVVNLDRADNEQAFDQPFHSTSIELHEWRLVFWQADVVMEQDHRPELLPADLDWLEAELAASSWPAVVFSHVPLDNASMTGNYYFQENPEFATYGNVGDAQRIITRSGTVAACVAGHVHWNNLSRIDGIPFVSIQSLTESYTTQGDASGCWATLELSDRLRWTGHGADPIDLVVELGGPERTWTPPLAPFAEMARQRAERAAERSPSTTSEAL